MTTTSFGQDLFANYVVRRVFLLLIATFFCQSFLHGQMLDPAIDRPDEPFSYFSKPTDVVGVMDARAGTLISPEGYLYTGYGELVFFTGDPAMPVAQRVKTLLRGYLPVVEYTYRRDDIDYAFMVFAATLDGKPDGPLVNFVRVRIRNRANSRRVAHFATAVRYEGDVNTPGGVPDNRFDRPVTPKRTGQYSQLGEFFDPKWTYGFSGHQFLRGGKVLYLFPDSPRPSLHLTLKERYNGTSDLTTRPLAVQKTTPVGVVKYALPLDPAGEQQLEFKMPYVPVDPASPELQQIEQASFDTLLQQTIAGWEQIFARGLDISVPEEKVVDTFKANLVYDLIARDKVGDDYVQTVNKFHYHAFWLRDSSYIVRMYDVSGYPDFARQDLDFFAGWQQPDGNFVSQGGQFDGWGQTLWAYGQHYRITHDRAFAEKVYPSLQRAIEWLHKARQSDPLHVMPTTSPGDNEDVTGHVTGHNFWALAGLKNAILMAQSLGKTADATAWQREYDDYHAAFLKALNDVTARTNGYMPPGLENQHGQDWGNMLAVYPEQVLDPFDAKVTATLNATRAKYQEGIMTYGNGRFLHHYLTMKNTETEVIRGEQQISIEELYALLLHTSSTHAGFEFCIWPWSTRDFGLNLSPHGWFSAKFRTLLRDMMVREQGNELHLLSSISPEWIQTGKSITVRRAPTEFGEVNFELQTAAEGESVLRLGNSLKRPVRVIVHLPWFWDVTSATADGKAAPVSKAAVLVPPNTKEIRIRWTRKGSIPKLSYAQAVEDYKAEYRRRYAQFLSGSGQ